MEHSKGIGKLAAALSKAQGEISGALKDSDNPHFKSKFASLRSLFDVSREVLSRYELFVTQEVTPESVVSRIVHSSGQWIGSECPLIGDLGNMQKVGSAVTYARRYSLGALLGIYSDEDDDGEGAQGGDAKAAQNRPQAPQNASGDESDGWIHYDSAKWPKPCAVCGEMIAEGEPIDWNKNTKATRHPGGKCGVTPAAEDIPQHIKDAANWTPGDDDIPFDQQSDLALDRGK